MPGARRVSVGAYGVAGGIHGVHPHPHPHPHPHMHTQLAQTARSPRHGGGCGLGRGGGHGGGRGVGGSGWAVHAAARLHPATLSVSLHNSRALFDQANGWCVAVDRHDHPPGFPPSSFRPHLCRSRCGSSTSCPSPRRTGRARVQPRRPAAAPPPRPETTWSRVPGTVMTWRG